MPVEDKKIDKHVVKADEEIKYSSMWTGKPIDVKVPQTRKEVSTSNYSGNKCPNCETKNIDGAKFCSNCGEKIENDIFVKDLVDSNSDIIIEIKGGRGEFSHHYAVIKEDILLIGKKAKIVGSKINYIEIKYEDIKNIGLKIADRNLANIKIETKNGMKTKIKGFTIEDAAPCVRLVQNIMAGNKDILNTGLETDIKTDEIPIYPGNVDKPYIEFGLIKVRADSSLFSKTATMEDANARLREEAVKFNANAIINTKYDRSSSRSWRGIKAQGTAIFMESDEKKCPFCAEMIKKEAIKCKHCQSDITEV